VISLAVAIFISTPYAIDGDTVIIERERVRLVQIDTPEQGTCYAKEARRFTQQFMEGEGVIKLERDPVLDNRDGYNRQLRYLIKGGRNLNLELVRGGYAKPMFYNKVRGKYANLIEKYARNAEAKRLGVWSCKGEGKR
jgi:micrococcal nuclease